MAIKIPFTNIVLGSEKRSIPVDAQLTSNGWLHPVWGGTRSGATVNQNTSLGLSAVWSATRILSEDLAALPFNIHQFDNKGDTVVAFTHPAHALLKVQPNNLTTSFSFIETGQANVTLWGNFYALIMRDGGGRPSELIPFDPSKVEPVKFQNKVYYKVEGLDSAIPSDNIFHVKGLGMDELKGISVIRQHAENLGLSIAAQEFGSAFFGNGGHFGATLEMPGVLSDKAYERLKASIMADGGFQNAGKPKILEEGMKYNKITIPPNEAQYIETRQFQKEEIATIFRIPQHMMGILTNSTNNNIEHQAIEYTTHTVRPMVTRWEAEINRKLLREDEKGRFFAKFNLNGLLRGDAAARADYYFKMLSIGALTQNEIRKLEDMNSMEGGDRTYIPVNLMPVDKIDEFYNLKAIKTTP